MRGPIQLLTTSKKSVSTFTATRATNFPNCYRSFLLFCNFRALEVVTSSVFNKFFTSTVAIAIVELCHELEDF